MTDQAGKPLHILILGNLAPHRIGGAQVQARLLAERFAQRGHRVTAAGYGHPDRQLAAGGPGAGTIESVRLPTLRRHRVLRALSYAVSLSLFLLRRRHCFDAAVCYLLGESDLVLSLLKQLGLLRLPVIVCSAGFGRSGDAARLTSLPLSPWLVRMLRRQADAINIISPRIARELATLGLARKFIHIPNGVDLDARQHGHRRRVGGLRSFLFVGRLVRLKGCADLLEAVRRLDGAGLPLKLNIVGDGPLMNELRRRSRACGIDDKVTFHGAVAPSRMADHYGANSVLVLPSRREAQGMVVAEAMSLGLPVIVTRSGGPEYTVDRRMARICPPKDPAALAAAMLEMLQMPADALNAMGAAGRQHVRENYDIEKVADQYLDVLQRLAAGSGSGF